MLRPLCLAQIPGLSQTCDERPISEEVEKWCDLTAFISFQFVSALFFTIHELPALKPPSNKPSRRQNLHEVARFPAHASGLRGPTE